MLLQEKLKDKKTLLGSKSPRRKELLKGLELEFTTVEIVSDETYPEELKKEAITEFISKGKAAAYSNLKENEILITADTIVWLEDEKLGKPKDFEDAFRILSKMSGKTHSVYTSVTLTSTEKSLTFSDETQVVFDKITEEEIKFYIENFQPFDKAGAYGIQEWLGFAKISEIKGSYYNVMGLPLPKLYSELLKF